MKAHFELLEGVVEHIESSFGGVVQLLPATSQDLRGSRASVQFSAIRAVDLSWNSIWIRLSALTLRHTTEKGSTPHTPACPRVQPSISH